MKVLSPFILIKATKRLLNGYLITFPFAESFWGYAVVFIEGRKMWLLNSYSESQPYLPTEIPPERLKWRISAMFDKLDAWAVAEDVQLSDWATSRTYIYWEGDLWSSQKNDKSAASSSEQPYLRAKVFGPKNVMHYASEEEILTYPSECSSSNPGNFLMERLAEMECINGQEGWTPITPEALAKAKKPARPKPTGERRIEVYIFNYEKTLITDRGELEEEIQEAIGEDGFVSGGGSVVNSRQEEGGHVDVECDSESYAKVLRGIRKVLFKFQCPADTPIADITLMDDGTTKQKEFPLGEVL